MRDTLEPRRLAYSPLRDLRTDGCTCESLSEGDGMSGNGRPRSVGTPGVGGIIVALDG